MSGWILQTKPFSVPTIFFLFILAQFYTMFLNFLNIINMSLNTQFQAHRENAERKFESDFI